MLDAQAFKAAFEYAQRNNIEIKQNGNGTTQPPATHSLADAFAMVGRAGTATLGGYNEGDRNHGPGAGVVPGRERRDDIGPA